VNRHLAFAAIFGIEAMQCSLAYADNYEDYLNYAKEQPRKSAAVIAPHLQEIAALQQKSAAILQNGSTQNAAQVAPQSLGWQNLQAMSYLGAAPTSQLSNPSHPYAHAPLFIFVSFSMPRASLKQWLWQAQKINAAVVIRGLVNNSFKDTATAVADLIKEHPTVANDNANKAGIQTASGLAIDPTLFQKFGITKVPAVVIASNYGAAGGVKPVQNFDIVYGDVPLDYALDKLGKCNDEFSQIMQAQLKILRSVTYHE
jgi:type-F conjugative transfer system pilin assembly protein TrbC